MSVHRDSNASRDAVVVEFYLDEEMAAFDRLPPAVRAALADATVKFAAADMEQAVAFLGPELSVAGLHRCEANEREEFGARHRRRYGYELPHIAAGVRPQRSLPPPAEHSTRRG